MPHCAQPWSLRAVLPDEAVEVCDGDYDAEEANEEPDYFGRLPQSRPSDPDADCEWGHPMMGKTQSMASGISYVAPMESMGPRMSKLRSLQSLELGIGSESESGETHEPGSMAHNVSEVTSMMSSKRSLVMDEQPSNTSSCSGGSDCSPCVDGALSLEEQKQRWLQRKERIRKKKELCGETYGNLVRNEYGSDSREEQVRQICAQHGFQIRHVELLGSGSFARVWRGKLVHKLDNLPKGQKVAVKMTRERFSNSTSAKRWLEREVQTMMVARHENLVHLYKAFISQNSTFLCMEYCGGGTVHEAAHGDLTFSLSTVQRVKILADIAEGLVFLHSHQIIHRDLKPSNVLIKSKLTGSDDTPHAKVCDFGLSRILAEGAPSHQTMDVGSPVYRAPEINSLTNLVCSRTYTVKADVYSYAITVNEVLTGKNPFEEHRASASKLMLLVTKDTRPNDEGIPDDTPAALLDIMRRGWQMIPEERPDFAEIAAALQACQPDAAVSI